MQVKGKKASKLQLGVFIRGDELLACGRGNERSEEVIVNYPSNKAEVRTQSTQDAPNLQYIERDVIICRNENEVLIRGRKAYLWPS